MAYPDRRITYSREFQNAMFDKASVLDICLQLRMGVNGSADFLSESDIVDRVWFLEDRIECWQPSSPASKKFDKSVKRLMLDAIAEAKHFYPGLKYRKV